ncbi:MAG: HNH endonuclease [Chromatiales bacterium]
MYYQRYSHAMEDDGSHNSKYGSCELCRRTTRLTFHHLIPRKLHRRNRFRKNYTREELNLGIAICRRCHNGLHLLYDEMTLAKHFSTLDTLLADDAIKRHVAWAGRQKGD